MHDISIAGPGFTVRRVPADRQVLLHCHPEAAGETAQGSGLQLPEVMLTSATTGSWSALHLSPDEWLLIGEPGAEDVTPRFAGAAHPLSLVDVSERSLAVDIAGPNAAGLLNCGCPLDFDRFGEGSCTRTLFGKVTVMLWWRDHAIRMSYSRSYDDYIRGLIAAVAQDLADDAR